MRYFFSVRNGGFHRDEDGTEYPSHEQARLAATQFAGELMTDDPELAWENNELEVRVANLHGLILFTVLVKTAASP